MLIANVKHHSLRQCIENDSIDCMINIQSIVGSRFPNMS